MSPLLLTAVMVLLLTNGATRGFAIRVSRENGVIELTTAGLMLAGGVYGLCLAWRTKKQRARWWVRGFFGLFSLGMLFIGMEEVAWGQKLFAYRTPAAFENLNQQHEMTVHNLPALHGHSDWMWAAFAVGGLLGNCLGRWPMFAKIGTPGVIAPWFLMILTISLPLIWRDYLPMSERLGTLLGRMDEFNEMLIAMACCLYVWRCARRLSYGKESA